MSALLAGSAFGATIISDTYNGAGTTGSQISPELLVVSWTETNSYTGVDIGANLATDNGLSTSTGTAYLTTQIGPGTTALNNEVAHFAFSVTGNPGLNAMTPLFTGLSLGPGTYYLTIDPNSGTFFTDWDGTSAPLETLASGVTQGSDYVQSGTVNGTYPPASNTVTENYFQIFSVTGTLAAVGPSVPEPSGVFLMAAGLSAIGGLVRRRKDQRRLP